MIQPRVTCPTCLKETAITRTVTQDDQGRYHPATCTRAHDCNGHRGFTVISVEIKAN